MNVVERLWRGVAVIHSGTTPPEAGERIIQFFKSRHVPAYILPNKFLKEVWGCYDALIFVEALGGVVRLLCGLARDKEVDPLVLAVDRGLRYFIPILGAHRGANELAQALAEAFGGHAVVTTAVEYMGFDPPEELERRLLCVLSREVKLSVAAALRDGRPVCISGGDPAGLRGYVAGDTCDVVVEVGDCPRCCRPLKLYVGFGATSRATPADVAEAVVKTLKELGIPTARITAVVSIKPMVKEVAAMMGVPGIYLKPWELRTDILCASPPSPKAMETLGIPGVAEIAAMTAAGKNAVLVIRKRAIGGVTVAVAGSWE